MMPDMLVSISESESCWGGAMQDQRGKELYTGKVSCSRCYVTLVLPLYTNESRHAYECKKEPVVTHRCMSHVTNMNQHYLVSDHPQQSCFDARIQQESSKRRPCCRELDHERMSVKLDVVQMRLYCSVCMCTHMVTSD